MCGIIGGVWSAESDAKETLNRALKMLVHRGPDNQGYIFLNTGKKFIGIGHARLAIIDLNPISNQPFTSADGTITITFNGEIYNYVEIRDELKQLGYVFKTESDTEVLVNAWHKWRERCLKKLVGMFAFAVYDKIKNSIICVRDAFGIKPLYYFVDQDRIIFASEVAIVARSLNSRPKLNYQTAYEYLIHGDYDRSNRTFFQGIDSLEPGGIIEFNVETNKIVSHRVWWAPVIKENSGISFSDAVEEVRQKFLNNVRLHLRSDVKIGATLSGGLDSAAIVCAIRHLEPDCDIHTFSYIDSEKLVSEENWVKHVCKYTGSKNYSIKISSDQFYTDIDELVKIQGEPFGSTSIYAQYAVYRHARECGVTVMLDGQGADEILGGYDGYPGQRLHSFIDTQSYIDALRFLWNWGKLPGRDRLTALKMLVANSTEGSINKILRRLDGRSEMPLWVDRKQVEDLEITPEKRHYSSPDCDHGRRVLGMLSRSVKGQGLQSLLRHGDRNSMRFSIESRVPFLTTDFADFLFSLPENYLISNEGVTKHVFRKAMKGILPDLVIGRKDKIGFATSEKDWVVKNANILRNVLKTDLGVPFIKTEYVLKEFDAVCCGKIKYSWRVWRWINFWKWHQHYLGQFL